MLSPPPPFPDVKFFAPLFSIYLVFEKTIYQSELPSLKFFSEMILGFASMYKITSSPLFHCNFKKHMFKCTFCPPFYITPLPPRLSTLYACACEFSGRLCSSTWPVLWNHILPGVESRQHMMDYGAYFNSLWHILYSEEFSQVLHIILANCSICKIIF
jgi:hypothetical protein